MKRVVFYTRAWRSGTGLYGQGVARGLALAGYPVTFICPAGSPADPAADMPQVRRIRPLRELTDGGVRDGRRLVRSLVRIIEGLGATAAARLSASRFAISIPDPFVFSIWLMVFLRLTGAQVVFICHDPKPHAWKLPLFFRPLESLTYRWVYHLANEVVVLASSSVPVMTDTFGVPASRVRVIPHGAFDFASVGPVTGSRVILALGTIRRNKHVQTAIEAVLLARQQGCDVRLVVAGGPDPDDMAYVGACREAAKGHEDCIDIKVGFIPDAEMMALVAQADALVLPYADFDSQSGVAVLAGMCGRPVIAAPAGGIVDLIALGLATSQISTPVAVQSVADAIIAFYATPAEEWTRRADAGRAALAHALDWRRIGEQLGATFR